MVSTEGQPIGQCSRQLTLKSELRHLPHKDRSQLQNLLDVNDNWKKLAEVIPKPDGAPGLLLRTCDINILDALPKQGVSPTQALLDHWGTSGRKRATIEDLIKSLNSCALHRASLYLCKDLLKIESFDQHSDIRCDNEFDEESINQLNLNINDSNSIGKYSDCDKWDDLSTKLVDDSSAQTNANSFPDPSAPNESLISFSSYDLNERQLLTGEELNRFAYQQICWATDNFNDVSVADGGHKLGEGAFGAVYRCRLTPDSDYIAVKKLKNDFQRQFLSEMRVLTRFRHENLLPLRGISSDGPSLIIVYDYMANGSLQDCLEQRPQSLRWSDRFAIALGTARGICHLHTFEDKPYVHRDIKSANILLDHNMRPRVGDFGLVRMGSSANTSTKQLATSVFGTSLYMAPEAHRGDISVKLDSFSFGVVLLELLTGQKPYDKDREEGCDILSFVEDMITDLDETDLDAIFGIDQMIDRRIDIDLAVVRRLWPLSRRCTENRKRLRPTMTEVLESLSAKIEFKPDS